MARPEHCHRAIKPLNLLLTPLHHQYLHGRLKSGHAVQRSMSSELSLLSALTAVLSRRLLHEVCRSNSCC